MTATWVKVTCPSCGHVRLSADDVRLVVAAPPRGPYYLFRCPGCDRRVRRPAPSEVVAVLTEHGVPTVRAVSDASEPGTSERTGRNDGSVPSAGNASPGGPSGAGSVG